MLIKSQEDKVGKKRKPKGKVIKGKLEPFFETGTEGIIWSVYENGKEGYDALNIIDEGDYLTVYWKNGQILFEDRIQIDFEVGWTPYPKQRKNGQPQALGHWVHWTQKGWDPNLWALLFLEEYSAELIKKPKQKRKTKTK